MSIGLVNSTIETFRKRAHGNDRLRIYRLNTGGQTLSLIAELTKGFFMSPNEMPHEGAARYTLAIDLPYTPALTKTNVLDTFMLDFVDPITSEKQRFQVNSNTPPTLEDWRFLVGVDAAFNDAKAVV
jgi:hypothetical protein